LNDAEDGRSFYGRSFVLKHDNSEARANPLAERYDESYVVQNPPSPPLTTDELDAVYELPFAYDQHPVYADEPVPALHEIRFSIAHVRGCFGNCAFCAVTRHQGRTPTGRSVESVLREARRMTRLTGFKGYIHDLGGPTANIMGPACERMADRGACTRKDCLFPKPCPNLNADHAAYLDMLKAVRELPHIRKVFIRSGIRCDFVLADARNGTKFIDALARYHVSGQLKIAPEHSSSAVLRQMHKPAIEVCEQFAELFRGADEKSRKGANARKPQFILPYYISAHPGCTLADARALSEHIKSHGNFVPDQIQDFYPTPGTLATCVYYTGEDPFTGEKVYVPGKNPDIPDERRLQRALLHAAKPEHRKAAARALSILAKENRL
jgi:uncharacterized radical SAM protein YgiQ